MQFYDTENKQFNNKGTFDHLLMCFQSKSKNIKHPKQKIEKNITRELYIKQQKWNHEIYKEKNLMIQYRT